MITVEAFILAGGKSTRMGSDKGLLEVAGKPMIVHLLESLACLPISTTIISGNARYEKFNVPVVPDLIPGLGPLGGLYTALCTAQSSHVLLLSCDMPFIDLQSLQQLIDQQFSDRIIAALIRDKINPMPAVYPVSYKVKVKQSIDNNLLKMSLWLLNQQPETLVLKENIVAGFSSFCNLNCPNDLQLVTKKE